MSQPLFPSIHRTIERIRKNPQLFWSIFVALVITAAFIFIAQMFISIAQDAQDRLVNVRIGSIQDSLSQFVELNDESKAKIDSAIVSLSAQNPTILDFTFYKKEGDELVVFASSDKGRVGQRASGLSPIVQIALNDARNSYTTELQTAEERRYQTFRALTKDGQTIGLIETTQTLSQADQAIAENIRRGIIIFICILILVMFLFFRHSRIIDYTSLYEELKKVDTLKDDFISMASHELKTPLAAIRGYSEFITEGENIPPEYKEYSRRIDVSSKQLALLVEDMLDVSRIEQDRMDFKEEKIFIPTFVESMAADFETLTKQKGLAFKIEQQGLKFASIVGDRDKLRQVLVNVVGNAIKYTKQGEVRIVLSNLEEKLEIRVIDTGVGMSEEEGTHLFEKFHRIRNSETQSITGTGLGLWITKRLVERMGGTISVESIKGVGTHIMVRFPGVV